MSTIRPGQQAALVVVDVQVGVMADAWDAARVIGNVAHAVERARQAGVPVVWVQHEDDGLPRGAAPWQLVPELVPAPDEPRVCKRYNSSFESTDLEDRLAAAGVSHIVLAGAATNGCIRATAHAALERGDDLTLLKDAHTTAPIESGTGVRVEAAGIVADLNVAMTWLRYPGRRNGVAVAADVDFGAPVSRRIEP